MARGKEAVASARRQVEAMHAVIDRLTTENADLKVRAKRVETAASRVPSLESRVRELERQTEDDEVLSACLERIEWHRAREKTLLKALHARERALFAMLNSYGRVLGLTRAELMEFAWSRFPEVFTDRAKEPRAWKGDVFIGDEPATTRHLPEGAVRRLQALRGDRHVDDMVALVADAEEALELGFSRSEVEELLA